LTAFEASPPRRSFIDRLRATLLLEDVLGMNLFAKIGIILLVLGFALLGRVALVAMGPKGKVALTTSACVMPAISSTSAAIAAPGLLIVSEARHILAPAHI
jgi:hypothetical protein